MWKLAAVWVPHTVQSKSSRTIDFHQTHLNIVILLQVETKRCAIALSSICWYCRFNLVFKQDSPKQIQITGHSRLAINHSLFYDMHRDHKFMLCELHQRGIIAGWPIFFYLIFFHSSFLIKQDCGKLLKPSLFSFNFLRCSWNLCESYVVRIWDSILYLSALWLVISSDVNCVFHAVPTLQSVEWQEKYADVFVPWLHFHFACINASFKCSFRTMFLTIWICLFQTAE